MLQSWRIDTYYSSWDDWYYYDVRKESQMFFNAYGILALRKNNWYLYANLGTKIGVGTGINISNFIIDVSYNKYLDRELDYGYKLKADKAVISVGYKFSIK